MAVPQTKTENTKFSIFRHVDATTRLDIELEQSEISLDEIVVMAERPLIKRDITGTSHVVESKQIELLPVDNIFDLIATQPGVTRDLHIRGGRKAEIQFLVDGLPFTEAQGGDIGGMLPKNAILEMKILTGGFDAEYGNALSGVINIITRRGSNNNTFSIRGDVDHYFNNPETNFQNFGEISMSGPLGLFGLKDMTFFSAMDFKTSDTRWADDFHLFFDGKIVKEVNSISKVDYNITDNLRVYVQVLTSMKNDHDYEFRWRDNLRGLPERKKKSSRISVGLTQFLTKNTFYNIRVSRFSLKSHLGPEKFCEMDTTDLFEYDFYLRYVKRGKRLWWADENQSTWTIKGDITSQFHEKSSTKVGGELTFYNMDIDRVKYEPQYTYFGKPLIYLNPLNYSTSYNYNPRAGFVFIQNKLRVSDGGTFSLGGRWDFFDPRAERPNLEWIPTSNDDFEKEITEWIPASVKHRFSIRLGYAIPVSDQSFVFVNFGHFFQMPLFDQLYSGMDINLKKKNSVLVGNPDMKPQFSRAWEVSYRKKIGKQLTIVATFFDKVTENLVDTRTFLASDSKALDDGYFAQYVNSPFANSNGIEFSIEKHGGSFIFGRFSYSFMRAEGMSEQSDQELNYMQWGFTPGNRLYPLSWDQRHTVNALISTDITEALTCDIIINYHSPRPYTYYPSRDGFESPDVVIVPNNKRMKHNLYIDLKAVRRFKFDKWFPAGWEWKLYYDVRNILDKKNLLWVDSSGIPGGELLDPGAYDMPRRARIGLEISFK
jgi:outer membrane receptor protein involved in Fe transport